MPSSVVDGDLTVRGNLYVTDDIGLPAGSVGDSQIDSGDPITAAKLQHQYSVGLRQEHGSAAVAERRVIHCAYAAGSVVAVRAGVVVACIGDSTITVDVYKNGVSILSAPIVLDNTNVAYAEESGSISSASYAAGDVLEVVVTVSAGTGTLGQGLYVDAVLRESAG